MRNDIKQLRELLLLGLFYNLERKGYPLSKVVIDEIMERVSIDPWDEPTGIIMEELLNKGLMGMTIHELMTPYYVAIDRLDIDVR